VRQPHALLAFVLIAFAAGGIAGEFVHSTWTRSRLRHENPISAAWGLFRSGRRRYGARLVHLALLLMGVGIVGSAVFKTEGAFTLTPGGAGTIQNYTIVYEDLSMLSDAGKHRFLATIGIYQGPTRVGTLRPEKDLYLSSQEVSTEVAIRSTLREDLYIALDVLDEEDIATFRVSLFPLIIWLWAGGGLLLLGTLIALWPDSPGRP
jgi:cytochrome c-type biogenesis protein CcmF